MQTAGGILLVVLLLTGALAGCAGREQSARPAEPGAPTDDAPTESSVRFAFEASNRGTSPAYCTGETYATSGGEPHAGENVTVSESATVRKEMPTPSAQFNFTGQCWTNPARIGSGVAFISDIDLAECSGYSLYVTRFYVDTALQSITYEGRPKSCE